MRNIFLLVEHEPKVNNFVNRFLYEIYLEACLCIMIALARTDLDSTSHWTNKVVAIVGIIGCFAFIGYVVSLYWTRIFQYTRGNEDGHEVVDFTRDMLVGIWNRHFSINWSRFINFNDIARCCKRCKACKRARKLNKAESTENPFTPASETTVAPREGEESKFDVENMSIKKNEAFTDVISKL